MSDNQHPMGQESGEAAEWLIRLNRSTAGEAEWVAFDGWLNQSPKNAAAYDHALALWQEIDRQAPALKQLSAAAVSPLHNGRRFSARFLSLSAIGGIAAALIVGLFLGGGELPWQAGQTYQTAKGEKTSIVLADGTHVDLDAASRLSVRFSPQLRRVAMDDGEAVFDVTPDASRPFVITVGDRTVRVVGTEFDVRHRGDSIAVTVSRGVVEVAPRDTGLNPARLTPGNRLDHREGAGESVISTVSADEIFSWRTGKLIYRHRPLSEVVADLNAQFAKPVQLADQRMADSSFSGVLILDDEDSVIHRLTLLTPLWSSSSPTGIVLRAKETPVQ
jgi:transmembrane sensor